MNLLEHKEELKELLKKEFDIDMKDIVTFKGTYKKSFKVIADKTYFMKCLPFMPGKDQEDLFFENIQIFKEEIRMNGITVLDALKTKDGRYYCKLDRVGIELYEFVDDLSDVESEEDLLDIVLKMHSLKLEHDYSNHPTTAEKRIEHIYDFINSKKVKAIFEFLKEYECRSEKFIVHGDLHMENLLRLKDSLVLSDFEIPCYGSHAYDLAMTFVCRPFFTRKGIDTKKIGDFLVKYSKKMSLSRSDISAIIAYMIVCMGVRIRSARSFYYANKKISEQLVIEKSKLKYVIDNYESLIDIFTSRLCGSGDINSTAVEIKVGTLCNNNCVFCLNNSREWDKTTDQIKNEIIEAKLAGATSINFTGGEVTIRKDFVPLLKYARYIGLKVGIHTNGRSFAYMRFAEDICSEGVANFLVSLHTHTPELYRKITKTAGYEQTIKGINNLRSLGQNITINCVISKKNLDYLPDIAKHHSKLDVSVLQFGWVTPKGRAEENFEEFVPSFREGSDKLFEALDWLDNNYKGIVYTLGIPFCILKKRSFFKMTEYSDQKTINDGNIQDIVLDSKLQNKTKKDTCEDCFYCTQCEGVFNRYVEKFGFDEFVPTRERYISVLPIFGFCPEKMSDDMPNRGAYRVTNDLLLALEKSDKVDKIFYFIQRRIHERQSKKLKIFPENASRLFAERFEKEIVSAYCIKREFMKILEDFSFKKIALIHSQDSPDLLEIYSKYIFKWNKKNCFWISPSETGKRIALDIFSEFERTKGSDHAHRIEVIPWGVNSIDQKKIEKKSSIKILYFGRIDNRYKIDILPMMFIFKKMKLIYPEIELHLAGAMAEHEPQRLNSHIDGDIIYHGEVSEINKMDFISSFDIFLSPVNSTQETFGSALIEAASRGLICLGSDWNGYNEILAADHTIRVDVDDMDIRLPVGKEKSGYFVTLSEKICKGIRVDWDDCYLKLEQAIQKIKTGLPDSSLKHPIEEYLWSNILKKHELLWTSEDKHDKDIVIPIKTELTVPLSIFLPDKCD